MKNVNQKTSLQKLSEEHILVCLSSAPSNMNIIQTAANMAQAFSASFTALFVQTPAYEEMSESDKQRLADNTIIAQKLGAIAVTVYGDDVSYQIAEYARLSGVTKIVIGHSNIARRYPWSKPTLTDQLINIAPDIEIHIIPDHSATVRYNAKKNIHSREILPSGRDMLKTMAILAISTLIGFIFQRIHFNDANIITIYILGVLLTSLFTKGHICSIFFSLASVLLFDFFFTDPKFTFHTYKSGYPFTFAVMLIASLITGTLATRLKQNAKHSAQSAYRTKILFDANQLLQKSASDIEILHITAGQITKLLNRNVVVYAEKDGRLSEGITFSRKSEGNKDIFLFVAEDSAAKWAFSNKKRCGAGTSDFSDVKGLYLPIATNNRIYGIIGILIENRPLESFEYSIVMSIIGECALAVENFRNAKAREAAAEKIKNEQLRSNLLRTISHDLRTPLTSILGNADNLLTNYNKIDDASKTQSFTDIYDDAQWLINVVENLLSVTRIEEDRMKLNMSDELINDVVFEAMTHISRKKTEHNISTILSDEILMAKIDARLIILVIVNLIENAIKYTPVGSNISVYTGKRIDMVYVSVSDNGPGISEGHKKHIFEMFYTGEKKLADSRRSLGLGLSLCKSIIEAHGGSITVSDNTPTGCIFTFYIPQSEVKIHE